MINWLYRLTNFIKEEKRPNEYKLYEYVIRDGKKHPFAIICPGGAYEMICDHMEGRPIANYLNSLGISAFVLQYRRKQLAIFPHPMEDLTQAIQYCFDNLDNYYLEKNYSIWGFSAGGHLAAYIGEHYQQYNIPKPNLLALAYPVNRFDELANEKSKKNLIGLDAPENAINHVCIDLNMTEDFPKTYLWCGDKDKTVDPKNCDLLVYKFKDLHIPYIFRKFHNVPHGVGLGEGYACFGWAKEAISYWLD